MTLIVAKPRRQINRTDVPGRIPTVPTSNDHTDGTWIKETDIYIGEFFLNTYDDKLFTRTESGIVQIYPQDPGVVYATVLSYDTFDDLPTGIGSPAIFPLENVIYITKDTNLIYRWDIGTGSYFQIATAAAGTIYWADIIDGPASFPVQIDATVAASHGVNDTNTSHYTKVESDGPAGNAGAKVDKVAGYGLSQEDFTSAYKAQLDNILVPVEQYVDEVAFPAVGQTNKLYYTDDTKQIFYWNDIGTPSSYVELNPLPTIDTEKLTLENIVTPTIPISGSSSLYFDIATGHLFRIDDTGAVVDIESASSNFWQAGTGTDAIIQKAGTDNFAIGDNSLAINSGNFAAGTNSKASGYLSIAGISEFNGYYIASGNRLVYYSKDLTANFGIGDTVAIYDVATLTMLTQTGIIDNIVLAGTPAVDTVITLASPFLIDYSGEVLIINLSRSVLYNSAEGNGTRSFGEGSHSEGVVTTASGQAAHAEGLGTTASGIISHAEGYNTTASGTMSHAEGESTTSSSIGTHAEGGATIASGQYAHAEGYASEASGYVSHAEGSSIASGEYSHAEGASSATGNNAHSEGGGEAGLTIASGNYSHAEGLLTEAQGAYSHAEGMGAVAYLDGMHAKCSNDSMIGQYGNMTMYATTTDATPVEFLNRLVLKDNTVYSFKWSAITSVYDPGYVYSIKANGLAKRIGGVITILPENTIANIEYSDWPAGTVYATVEADNINNSLKFVATDTNGTGLDWMLYVEWTEMYIPVS